MKTLTGSVSVLLYRVCSFYYPCVSVFTMSWWVMMWVDCEFILVIYYYKFKMVIIMWVKVYTFPSWTLYLAEGTLTSLACVRTDQHVYVISCAINVWQLCCYLTFEWIEEYSGNFYSTGIKILAERAKSLTQSLCALQFKHFLIFTMDKNDTLILWLDFLLFLN